MPESTVPESLRLAAAIAWRVLIVGAAIVIVAYVVAQLRIIAIPCFVALLLATQLSPLVDRLEARWLPRWIAALLALLLGLTVVAGLTAALVGTVIADFDRLDVDFEGGVQEVGDFLVERLDIPREDVDNTIDDLLDNLRNNTGTIMGGVFSGASVAIELAAGVILAVVVLFFALKDGRKMWRWSLRLVPESRADGCAPRGPAGMVDSGPLLPGHRDGGVLRRHVHRHRIADHRRAAGAAAGGADLLRVVHPHRGGRGGGHRRDPGGAGLGGIHRRGAGRRGRAGGAAVRGQRGRAGARRATGVAASDGR